MHFLSLSDISKENINVIFGIAEDLKNNKETITLRDNATMALLFEKPSTRTHVSFEVAMAQLGGEGIYIDQRTSQISRHETLADTARTLSLYVDFIGARMYKHSDLQELADHSAVPVINALTDLEHPCQGMSDLYTIKEEKGKIKGLKISFIGDIASNTVNSLMIAAAKFGAEISLVGPSSYRPNTSYFTKAREYAKVDLHDNIEEGLADSDVIYTDTFVSMGEESEMEIRRKIFAPYQLNQKAVEYAKSDVIVMHPLPAHRGEEITSEVIDGARSVVWKQAKNKLLLEKAIILYLSEQEM